MKGKSMNMNKLHITIWSFVIMILFVLICVLINQQSNSKIQTVPFTSMSYLEDKGSTLTIDTIHGFSNDFLPSRRNHLKKGQSRSTFWIRISVDEFPKNSKQICLAITNPTVKKIVLYYPDQNGFEALHSGWYYADSKQDVGYIYPVFSFTNNFTPGQYLYLQCTSPFTQNYNIEFFHSEDFANIKLKQIFLFGIFFGLLLFIIVDNLIKYFALRDTIHLYYVLYIFSMFIYQGVLLGIFKLILGDIAQVLTANTVAVGEIMMFAVLMFTRVFLNTKVNFHKLDIIPKTLMVLCLLGSGLTVIGFKYEASVLSAPVTFSASLFILFIAIISVRKKISFSEYFLVGWSFIVIGVFLFMARVWGLIPNNDMTLSSLLFSTSIESIVFSTAISRRIQLLDKERKTAYLMQRIAEERSLYNESAFLRSQIKPHFLYNALNVIATLCHIDPNQAERTILNLSKYLRYSFDFRNLLKYIPISEELKFINAYVEIEQMRFKDKLNIEYHIDDITGLMVPPMIIEPLVENAIRHGIRKTNNSGNITLTIKDYGDEFFIEVADNGQGMTSEKIRKVFSEESEPEKGIGLANIQKRLKLLYNTELIIQSVENEGTKISMILPKKKGDTHESNHC